MAGKWITVTGKSGGKYKIISTNKEIEMTSKNEREEKVEVHGMSGTKEGSSVMNLLMKATGISQFVEPYRANSQDISASIPTIRELANGCPKLEPDGWMEHCGDDHPIWNTMAVLRRGALKEPTKSGNNAGQIRDPSIDFNYKWEVVSFIEEPTAKPVTTNGKPTVQAKLDDATVLMLQKEFISNDRTALMQAVEFGSSDSSNILSEGEVMRLTSLWGNLLNERALSRLTQATLPKLPIDKLKSSQGQQSVPISKNIDDSKLVQSAIESGAVVTDVKECRNIEDVKSILAKRNPKVEDEEIARVLKKGGYNRGKDWLKKNGEDNFTGLLDFIEKGLSASW
jgi:hypothetical protein